ncbi:MAG: FAD-dependent oxidoreductase, partial [Candidatus Heimdallarchaeota archaeon]|nr:FAD-dependent oxidoreductase [Candidatus Heimdallarchaeota archaeon]
MRSGGHHVAGTSTIENGFIIDISSMKDIEVDADMQKATVDAGVTIGELDQATQEFGLLTPMGVVSKTGIAGLTLGGGLGWFRNKLGYSSDNVLQFEVVNAEGELMKVDNNTNQGLFWALRGAGGNFCIITKFTFQLYELGTRFFMTALFYKSETIQEAKSILTKYTNYLKIAPEEVSPIGLLGEIPGNEHYPQELVGKKFTLILAVYAGSPEMGKEVMAP